MLANRMRMAAGGAGADANIILTQKGYGSIGTGANDAANLALSYGTVNGGSAPTAGDLVVWSVYGYDWSASPIQNLTGSGWTQSSTITTYYVSNAILSKVLVAADISSPPTIVSAPDAGAGGMWVAYTPSGKAISSLAIGGHLFEWNTGTSPAAPANKLLSMSALTGVLIAGSIGTGDDNSVLPSWSGATPDGTNAVFNLFNGATVDTTAQWKRYSSGVSGNNITVSKGDDGNWNSLAVFYVQVT